MLEGRKESDRKGMVKKGRRSKRGGLVVALARTAGCLVFGADSLKFNF